MSDFLSFSLESAHTHTHTSTRPIHLTLPLFSLITSLPSVGLFVFRHSDVIHADVIDLSNNRRLDRGGDEECHVILVKIVRDWNRMSCRNGENEKGKGVSLKEEERERERERKREKEERNRERGRERERERERRGHREERSSREERERDSSLGVQFHLPHLGR